MQLEAEEVARTTFGLMARAVDLAVAVLFRFRQLLEVQEAQLHRKEMLVQLVLGLLIQIQEVAEEDLPAVA
jgi:hypothetical protein